MGRCVDMILALADPNPVFRQGVAAAVRKVFPDADIFQADSGLKALRYIRSNPVDVLLCGLVLPELDGIGLLEGISELRQRPRVMVLTQITNETILSRTIGLGVDYYMLKPVEPTLVCRRLREMLKEPREIVPEAYTPPDCEEILRELGLPSRFSGYQYLVCAVCMAREEPWRLNRVTVDLYPAVAQRFGKTACNVERSIRYAIDLIWSRNSLTVLADCLKAEPACLRERPGNRVFLSILLDARR